MRNIKAGSFMYSNNNVKTFIYGMKVDPTIVVVAYQPFFVLTEPP